MNDWWIVPALLDTLSARKECILPRKSNELFDNTIHPGGLWVRVSNHRSKCPTKAECLRPSSTSVRIGNMSPILDLSILSQVKPNMKSRCDLISSIGASTRPEDYSKHVTVSYKFLLSQIVPTSYHLAMVSRFIWWVTIVSQVYLVISD